MKASMKFLAAGALSLLGVTPAFAGPVGSAAFASGVALPDKVVVNDQLWRCADGTCSGPGELRAVAMMRACKGLAREIGAVASFTVGVARLDDAAIQQCNAAVSGS